MNMGVKLYAGFHDEIVTCCKPEDCEVVIVKLKRAMELVNKQLKLKVPVGIDYKIGSTYAEVH